MRQNMFSEAVTLSVHPISISGRTGPTRNAEAYYHSGINELSKKSSRNLAFAVYLFYFIVTSNYYPTCKALLQK
jgi:hypothetical protein